MRALVRRAKSTHSLSWGARDGRPGGVVGEAQVDQVDLGLGQVRDEPVVAGAVQVDDALVAPVDHGAGAAGHHVGVQVDRVDRVGDGDGDVGGEDLLDVAGVALGAVADEHLVGFDPRPPGLEILGRDFLPQELVALLGAVAAEGGGIRHLVHRLVKGPDAGRGQGSGHVADAELDDVRRGVGLLVGRHAPGDLGEQVGGLELQVILVDSDHRAPLVF